MSPAELIAAISKLGGRLYLDDGELRLKAPKGSLNDELRAELKNQKQGLIEFLEAAHSTVGSSDTAITPASRDAAIPASFSQQRLWFLDELEPGNSIFNMPWSMRLQGTLNKTALQAAFNDLVTRHESLRTSFRSDGNIPEQLIAASMPLEITQELQHGASDVEIQKWTMERSAVPFNLKTGPLLRAHILETGNNDQRLLIIIHHIVSDAWSMSVLFQELSLLYAAHCTSTQTQLAELPVQYADYAVWQRNWLQGDELERQVSYWRKNLSDAPPLLELPTDRPRPVTQTYAGNHLQLHGSTELTQQLQQLVRPLGVSMFMLLQAAFNLVLARYAGTEDIVIGTPIAGRRHAELEPLIGFFLNTLVLRNDLSGDPDFIELLERVRKTTLAAYEHQDVPFEKLVEELRPDRELSHSPIFQVLFNVRAQTDGEIELHELQVDFDHVERNTAKVDLALSINESSQGLAIDFEYNTDLFDEPTMQGFASAYLRLLDAIAEDAQRPISELPLLTDAELEDRHARERAARPATDYTEFPASELEQSVAARFESQASVFTDQLAAHTADHSWSYAELNSEANRLAHQLLAGNLQQDQTRVGVLMGQSVPMLAGLLGVLKTGMAYVPTDPEAPTARHQQIAAEAGLSIIVTDAQHRDMAEQAAATGIAVVELSPGGTGNTNNPDISIDPDALAYILFTSGSTGTPKGVMQTHRNLLHHCRTYSNAVHIDSGDRLTLLPPYGFDAAVMDIFGALLNGASLFPFDLRSEANPEAICERIVEHRISIFHSTPTVFRYLLEQSSALDLHNIRLVVLGGEEARSTDFELFRRLFTDDAVLVNGLGPSESTLALQFFARHDSRLPGMVVPVGRAVHDTEIVLLDKDDKPSGICGELAIRSRYVTAGYWNAPELTAAALSEPDAAGRRLYRTGDHARYLADGQLVFTGREDAQIKLRGHRIEVGEIEAVLVDHPSVDNAVVVLRKEASGTAQLVAYLTPAGSETPDTTAIRAYLRAKLPAYMVPAGLVCLTELPMTASGKIDRKQLPAPSWEADTESYVAPRTPEELALAEIWSDILNVDRVGIQDDFFALGGHSLLATQVIARVRDSLNTELPLRAIFETPNIEGLAAAIASGDEHATAVHIPTGERPEYPPLSFAQQRLWFLDQLEPGNPVYNIAPTILLKGELNRDALQQALHDLVERHETLRTCLPTHDGEPYQAIHTELPVRMQYVDAREYSEAQLNNTVESIVRNRFNLAEGPLFQLHVLQKAATENILAVVFHHTISDGWSLDVFYRDLLALYAAACKNEPATLAPMRVQYADYAAWQRKRLSGEELQRQTNFWREHLEGAPPLLELPTDRPRPAIQSYAGARAYRVYPPEIVSGVNNIARQQGGTAYMVLLAAFNVLLARFACEDDIVVGTPIAGRQHTELEGIIGFFINTLVVRTRLQGDPKFDELVQQVKTNTLGGYAHQDMPFEKLVEELQPPRDLSHTPLFQVMFNLHNEPWETKTFYGLEVESMPTPRVSAKFDITVAAAESPDGLAVNFEYNTDLFNADTIERMLDLYLVLLERIVAEPTLAISQLLTAEQPPVAHKPALWDAQPAAAKFVTDNLISQFEHICHAHGDKLAVSTANQETRYTELNALANQIAHSLLNDGSLKGKRIGLLLGHDEQMVAGILGVLKTGATYVPLDAHWPIERLQSVFTSAELSGLVTDAAHASLASDIAAQKCSITNLNELAITEDSNPDISPTADDTAYILFTSGSTGTPKGVPQTHGNLKHHVSTYIDSLKISADDRLTLFSAYGFDASIQDIFGALLSGASLYPIDLREEQDFSNIVAHLHEQQISVLHITPTVLRHLFTGDEVDKRIETVRILALGGEEVRATDRQLFDTHFSDTAVFVNGLGLTESTMTAQYFADKNVPVSGAVIPIGRPVADTEIYLLDDAGETSAICGEICIRSDHLTPGYWEADDLTALAFETDNQGRRTYRPGDYAKYRYDGELIYTGRRDGQVKIRGHRIELAEIELALNELPGVGKSAILLQPMADGEPSMVAYLTPGAEGSIELEQVREHLRERLPVYMLPTGFVELTELPLTPSGKIDRQALPAYVVERDHSTQLVEPRTATEAALARIWKKLLQVDELGVHDDFFSLGGHSLLTIRLIREIEKETGSTLTIASVFEQPSIARLAKQIDSGEAAANPAAAVGAKILMPIRTSGTRTPLFCIDGEPMRMAASLSKEQPLYGLYHAYDPDFVPPDSIAELAEIYIREMRRVQPHGPYRLVGFCVGGLVAFEMVKQLQAIGESVDYLALIDPTIPGRRGESRVQWVRNTFSHQQKKLTTAWYFIKRFYNAMVARTGLGQRMVRGYIRKALGMELPLRLRHIQNQGKIRQAHKGYRYNETDQQAVIFLVEMEPELWSIYKGFWKSVFLAGADLRVIKGLKGHTEFLTEPFISNVSQIIEQGIIETDNRAQPAKQTAPQPAAKVTG